MLKKKYGNVVGVLLFIIVKYIDEKSADLLGYLHKFMASPFSLPFLQYQEDHSALFSTLQFVLLVCLYALIIFGFMYCVSIPFKKNNVHFVDIEDIESKLGDVIQSLENGDIEDVIDTKITAYMTAVELEIKRIFKLKKKKIDFIWYFPKHKDGKVSDDYELVYFKHPKDLHHAKFYISSSLDIEGIRFKEENVKGRMETPHAKFSQFITVRNVGKPRLGLAIFIYEDNVINEENEQEFTQFTSNFILLGLYEPFVKSIEDRIDQGGG